MNIKEKYGIEKREAITLFVLMILTFAGLIGTLVGFAQAIGNGDTGSSLTALALLVLYGLMIYYAFAGYKKPHGNLLKIILFVFAATAAINALDASGLSNIFVLYLCMAVVIIAAHLAGILDRFERCKLLFLVNFIIIVITAILDQSTKQGIMVFVIFSFPVLWLDIFASYVQGYKEHKEAGKKVEAE